MKYTMTTIILAAFLFTPSAFGSLTKEVGTAGKDATSTAKQASKDASSSAQAANDAF